MIVTKTAAQQGKEERDRRICNCFSKLKDKYPLRLELYLAIAREVGISHVTAYRVLRKNNLV